MMIFVPFKLITLKIFTDMLQDCYSYSSMDAPSELKILIMEEVGLLFDKIVLDGSSSDSDKKDLKKKLDKIEVRYREDV